jgi:hypothetical protein
VVARPLPCCSLHVVHLHVRLTIQEPQELQDPVNLDRVRVVQDKPEPRGERVVAVTVACLQEAKLEVQDKVPLVRLAAPDQEWKLDNRVELHRNANPIIV